MRSDFNQINVVFLGQNQRFFALQNAEILAFFIDDPQFRSGYLVVDSGRSDGVLLAFTSRMPIDYRVIVAHSFLESRIGEFIHKKEPRRALDYCFKNNRNALER